ncbi:MAG TPA: DUF362 domain-containing protein [bacterium]|nr:DUF362 domain-containing protein [bacterium]
MKRVVKWGLFPILGLLSLIWFLIRVIPKPSRVTYPCIQATAPLASSFVLWLMGLFSSVVLFRKAREYRLQSRHGLFSLAAVAGALLFLISFLQDTHPVKAFPVSTLEGPNQPIGEGKGVHPGRVVWVHDPDATNADYSASWMNYWYQDVHTNQDAVNRMFSDGLRRLTGDTSDAAAWDSIFRYHNNSTGKGDVGYQAGEKIVIKINLNGRNNYPQEPNINTSPQICYTVLDQLIRVVGVAQADIHIGDPNIDFDTPHWNKCHSAFPDVKYWGTGAGRTPPVRSEEKVLFTSDGSIGDWLPQSYLDAAYMINIPVFKKHHRSGISLSSKNHFGSVTPFNQGAWHWHPSLPCPDGGADVSNGEMGAYRCFVDLMGHKDLGGKTILHLVDGLWGSTNWGHPPVKWRMTPFHDDWPSSLFLSQDPVAVESVCFDFLYHEFDSSHPTEGAYDRRDNSGPFPQYAGTQDYLHQAADSRNWPAGIQYDPENDGTILPASLGVHEHWNNPEDKQYSRNLGLDTGIELLLISGSSAVGDPGTGMVRGFILEQNYPNPFNPMTEIRYRLFSSASVSLAIYRADGRRIRTLAEGSQDAGIHVRQWDGLTDSGLPAASGVYFCRIDVRNEDGISQQVRKMVLNR